jgi:uncharacterized protein YpuA (DUF1002 family)
VDKDVLAKAIIEGEEIELHNILTDEELDKVKKAKYDEGKTAGEEIPFKTFKKSVGEKYEIETEGIKDYESLLSKVIETKETHWNKTIKDSAGKKEVEWINKIEDLKKSNKKLADQLKESESNYETQLNEALGRVKKKDIDNTLISLVNTLNFEVPKHVATQGDEAKSKFIKTETDKFLTLLNNNYEFDISDKGIITKKSGDILKDKYEEMIPINKIVVDFAKEMNFNLTDKQSYKRNSGVKTYGSGNFSGMSEEEFKAWADENKIHPLSNDFNVKFTEWKKANN